jgi:hypothetical protein
MAAVAYTRNRAFLYVMGSFRNESKRNERFNSKKIYRFISQELGVEICIVEELFNHEKT